jgi:hypothetical protein
MDFHASSRLPSIPQKNAGDENMGTVGVFARFITHPGLDSEVEAFFKEGLAVVEQQPASTSWFAFRLGPTTYGAFATFANEEDRTALLSTGGPVSATRHSELFAQPPTFEKFDVLEARHSD